MDETTTEGTETPETGVGDGTESKHDELEKKAGEETPLYKEIGGEGAEEVGGEHLEGEHLEGEQLEGEHLQGEHVMTKDEEKVLGEGEELMGEHLEGEQVEGEQKEEKPPEDDFVEEEEQYVEEPPPDPTAPFDFSESKEALKPPFQLRPDQLAEVEQLWDLYQNYTPAYTDINGYITPKELFYMLKCLLLMTFTPEQFQELINWCVRPPHPEGHITYEQFLKMVTIRQRDFLVEDELREALLVFDPEKTGSIDRDELKEVLLTKGHRMPARQLENLIKEVDMSNDGTIGVEDVVGTMCIDLNKEDLIMLRNTVFPDQAPQAPDEQEEEEA